MEPMQTEALELLERGVALDAALEEMMRTFPEVRAEHALGILVGVYEPASATEQFAPVIRALVKQRKLDLIVVLMHTRNLHVSQALARHLRLDPEAFHAELEGLPIKITYAAK